ncbi:MAG: zinc ribbon domain-containing protein [Deltaproteobacteria bacterium]|nr:MAG: zinc ribbon domain-containing protein [Deltaproteobacteria bacterium]
MKCAACGTLNDGDAIYCKRCGAMLGEKKCPQCSTPADPDALFCSACGVELTSNNTEASKSCQSCGFVNPIGTGYCKRCNQKIL